MFLSMGAVLNPTHLWLHVLLKNMSVHVREHVCKQTTN